MVILICFILSVVSPLYMSMPTEFGWNVAVISHWHLDFYLRFDSLTWVMLNLVTFVSLIIYNYTARYLLSDPNQTRFMSQLGLLTFSVMLLMMSGSLFAAFVAWQCVGISLYLLLNHYHYDINANKSAKKKFIINRLGDISFLIAVIITSTKYGGTTFSIMFHHAGDNNFVIMMLIFIAIMTKSAQFPFHIWLIDTMEAPTPVSALMHAGVINSGGFLLARLSPLYQKLPLMLGIVFMVGFITAMLGNFFMRNQADVKKQLAYSTMGQMGYMVMQCGLGCFSSAVFHLISHAFYKAFSFLSVGGNLQISNAASIAKASFNQKTTTFVLSLFLSIFLSVLGYCYFHWLNQSAYLNPLLCFFIGITLFQCVTRLLIEGRRLLYRLAALFSLVLIMVMYLTLLEKFNFFLHSNVEELHLNTLGLGVVIAIISLVLILIMFYPLLSDKRLINNMYRLYILGYYKGGVESFYRSYIVSPLRLLGDQLISVYQRLARSGKMSISGVLICWLAFMLIYYSMVVSGYLHKSLMLAAINLLVLISLLLIANRVSHLKHLLVTLMIFSVCVSYLAIIFGQQQVSVVGVFHLVNVISTIIGLFVLNKGQCHGSQNYLFYDNRLPLRHFYICIFLILLIGIPGTSSFISEYYLLMGLLQANILFACFFIVAMLLLSLVVLHALQVYFFNPNVRRLCSEPVSKLTHASSVLLIGFNLFNGVHPAYLFHIATKVVGG